MEITDYIISKLKNVPTKNGRILVGVCGRSGAGKTTLTKKISSELNTREINNVIYSGDWRFNLDSAGRKRWLEGKWKAGIDAYLYAISQFSWWNFQEIYRDLDELMKGNDLEISNTYNRITGKKDLDVKLGSIEQGVIFFENSILGGVEKLEDMDVIVLINTADSICFERIIKKDSLRRSLSEIMVRNLITTYSENFFMKLLLEHFAAKTVTCNSNGMFALYPKISDVSHIPVPITKNTHKKHKKGTVFCDLDGVLIKHVPVPSADGKEIEIIEGSAEKLKEFRDKGYFLILTTSRVQSKVFGIVEKLKLMGLEFDQIICDLPVGPRHLINDSKNGEVRAFAHVLERDEGIKDIHLS